MERRGREARTSSSRETDGPWTCEEAAPGESKRSETERHRGVASRRWTPLVGCDREAGRRDVAGVSGRRLECSVCRGQGARLAAGKGGDLWYTSDQLTTLEYLETFRAE